MNSNTVYYSRYLCSPEITEVYCQVILVPRELTWSAAPYRHSNERGGLGGGGGRQTDSTQTEDDLTRIGFSKSIRVHSVIGECHSKDCHREKIRNYSHADFYYTRIGPQSTVLACPSDAAWLISATITAISVHYSVSLRGWAVLHSVSRRGCTLLCKSPRRDRTLQC